MHYYWATATDQDLFTVPDSGAGYVNPSVMSPLDRDIFVRFTRRWMGRLGESAMSFFLNGFSGPPSNEIMAEWSALGPDGVMANELPPPSQRMIGNVPWCAMDGNSWAFAGVTPAAAVTNVERAYTARFGTSTAGARFLNSRNVYVAPDFIETMFQTAQANHPDWDLTAVDPYTFGFLFRQANGGSNTQRASFLDDSLPRKARVGSTVQGIVRLRNDGWDSWSPTSCVLGLVVGKAPEVTPSKAAPGERTEVALPRSVGPGETVEVPVTLTLPSGLTAAPLSYDVSCGGGYFETALNVPYRDGITLTP
jgi:hypothetical protein